MFCGKCGANNPDGASFCKECGTPLASPAASEAEPVSGAAGVNAIPSNQTKNYKKIGITVVVLAALAVIFLLSSIFGGGNGGSGAKSGEEAALRYANAMLEPDSREMYRLLPEGVKGNITEETYDRIDEITISHLRWIEKFDEYEWEYSCEVTKVTDVSESRLKDIQKLYQKYKVKVTAAQEAQVMLTIIVGNRTITETITIPVIKIGSDWYMHGVTMSDIGIQGFLRPAPRD